MTYFFKKWDDFAERVKKKKKILLLFDFDGTLTPIASTPRGAKLSPKVKALLKKLSKNRRIGVGIVSGRELSDIMRLVGLKGIYYAGNHGLEIKGPGHSYINPACKRFIPYMDKIASSLRHKLSGIKGAILEHKRLSLSLHYRIVPPKDIPALKSIFKKIVRPHVKAGKVRISTGKKVFEVRPPVSWDKGRAVKIIEKMTKKKDAVKLFIGDDVTDEDAFRVLKKDGFPVHVGKKKSKAKYFLKDPNEVRRLLVKINRIAAAFLIVFTLSAYAAFAEAQKAASGNEAAGITEIPKTAKELSAEELIIQDEVFLQAEPEPEPVKIMTKVYSTRTEDGWQISMNRYTREDSDEKCKATVILCHGFNINNKFWDIDKRCSLARYLTENGYDVWAPSLRGSGLSSKPIASEFRGLSKFDLSLENLKNIPKKMMRAPFDLWKLDWTIDDHIRYDLPAIIDFVKKKARVRKVYWIGHSMGGIVMFGYLETETQNDIAGFIPMGSMMVIQQPLTEHLKNIAGQKPLLTASLLVNTTVASQVRNFSFGTIKHPLEDLLFESENMDADIMFRFFRLCIDDTAPGVVGQFSDSIKAGRIQSADGKFSYTDNIYRIKVPILIMGGSADGFVTEKSLRECLKKTRYSENKGIEIFSKANGYSTDYGHCDLVLGIEASREVYPVILKWLDKQCSNSK